MKRNFVIFAVLAFVVVFLLSGCGTTVVKTVPGPTVTATATATQTVTVSPSAEPSDDFTNFIRENTEFLDNETDDTIVKAGRAVCTDLNNGYTIDDELTVTINGFTANPEEAKFFIGSSISWYCPENQYVIEDYLSTYNPTA